LEQMGYDDRSIRIRSIAAGIDCRERGPCYERYVLLVDSDEMEFYIPHKSLRENK